MRCAAPDAAAHWPAAAQGRVLPERHRRVALKQRVGTRSLLGAWLAGGASVWWAVIGEAARGGARPGAASHGGARWGRWRGPSRARGEAPPGGAGPDRAPLSLAGTGPGSAGPEQRWRGAQGGAAPRHWAGRAPGRLCGRYCWGCGACGAGRARDPALLPWAAGVRAAAAGHPRHRAWTLLRTFPRAPSPLLHAGSQAACAHELTARLPWRLAGLCPGCALPRFVGVTCRCR